MLSNTLYNRPILGLHSGGQIGTALEPIINPHNLKIVGWWCSSDSFSGEAVLLADDVREMLPRGLAVNDETALSSPADLVRHQEVLNIRFKLLDKQVRSKSHKLGKVSDFTYDDSMFVQKLYVSKSLVKLFSSEDILLVARQQIVEVTDDYIIVEDTNSYSLQKSAAAAPASAA